MKGGDKDMEETKQKMPVGMILILILIGFSIFGTIFGLKTPVVQLGPVLLAGMGATFVQVVILTILVVIFVGIIKRFLWARTIGITWYILSVILSLVNVLSFKTNPTMYEEFYTRILGPEAAVIIPPSAMLTGLIVSLVVSSIIAIIVVIYLVKKKSFFTR